MGVSTQFNTRILKGKKQLLCRRTFMIFTGVVFKLTLYGYHAKEKDVISIAFTNTLLDFSFHPTLSQNAEILNLKVVDCLLLHILNFLAFALSSHYAAVCLALMHMRQVNGNMV
jgi:hypothetical protein